VGLGFAILQLDMKKLDEEITAKLKSLDLSRIGFESRQETKFIVSLKLVFNIKVMLFLY